MSQPLSDVEFTTAMSQLREMLGVEHNPYSNS
jgi:hypothetical protein